MLTGSPGGREVSAAAIPMMSVDLYCPGRIDKSVSSLKLAGIYLIV